MLYQDYHFKIQELLTGITEDEGGSIPVIGNNDL